MRTISSDSLKRAQMLYDYKLYSVKQIRTFSKYAWKTSEELSVKYGGSRVGYWVDMMLSNLRYGAMHCRDYVEFEFFRKNGREKNKFFTLRRYFNLIKHFDKETFFSLIDKASMYEIYSNYIHRDWLLVEADTPEAQIRDFVNKHGIVIVKPVSSDKGNGIFALHANDADAVTDLLEKKQLNAFLLEEQCVNCEELNAINSTSLNTLRLFTLVNAQDEVQILCAFLRCGRGGAVVDNWCAGGVAYPVDIDTGIISYPGVDALGKKYVIHPGTNKIMPGFEIPRFKEICALAKEIISDNKKIVYAGLDFAVLPDRVEFIEINFPAGYELIQTWDMVGKNHWFDHIISKN